MKNKFQNLTLAAVLVLSTTQALATLVVTSGTGLIGDGVSLTIINNGWNTGFQSGAGTVVGGTIFSPGGAPDLFFQAGDTPTFPNGPSTFVHWGVFDGLGEGENGAWEGAQTGTDNWMKVFRNGDSNVSWAQFTFDFVGKSVGDATLIEIGMYVTDTTGADISLDSAVAAAAAFNAVPEPSTLAIFALGMIGLASRRFKKQS